VLILLYVVNETFHRNVQVVRRLVYFFGTGFIFGWGSCTWVYGFDQKSRYWSIESSVYLPV